jgi:CheY-like chemotaxis protein
MRSTQGYARLCAQLAERLEQLEPGLGEGEHDALTALRQLRHALAAFGGARQVATSEGDIGRWLREEVSELERSSDLRVQARLDTGGLLMSFDQGALAEALRELCDNSQRAGASELMLATEVKPLTAPDVPPESPPGHYLEIELRDDGCGIPASLRHRALWPAVSGWQREGLGLARVQGIALGHGGWVAIGAEPRGASVRLVLPTGRPIADAASPSETTIVIVDDEPLALKALRRVLTGRGYRVISADTGRRALELVNEATVVPELLVSDINMPGMNGPTLAHELRLRIPDIAVLFVCGYPPEGLELPPGSRVLAKPFSHDELLTAVRQAVDPAVS